ncbi:xanthine dehydrogenase family protein molybdopterin-binding subunit [Aureimonas mangrovi]|uniref:xanthine dehydrogenase family protein molybdopterin-binding subunit n=1 Tax=Aureimonas mangrovi TaxID=2758041 RepID=UPI00163DDF53|nr:xanthine dehydrogenase family protein molybdopterin-binding subunit [Aureimonas mangrovi]
MSKVQNVVIGSVRTALRFVPSGWLPGGSPDPLIQRRVEVGRQTSRLDGPDKVRGDVRFAAEIPFEGLLYTALVHSPVTRGRITRVDTKAAEAAPGVALVVTHENMPRLRNPPLMGGLDMTAASGSALPILQDKDIRYNGQVVAAVLADSQERADHAASLIEVEIASQLAKTRFDDAKVSATTPPSILIDKNELSIGNAGRELGRAAHRVDNVYRTPGHNHNALELHTVTAFWEGEHLLVNDTTQAVVPTKLTLAKIFGIEAEKVRVISPFVGGGFGAKGMWDHHVIAVAAARLSGRPVRVTLTRESVYRIVGGRSPTEQRVAIGADAQGRFTAILHTGYSVKPPYASCPEPYTGGTRAAYAARSFEIVQRHLDLDIVPNTFMRAPGEAIGTFALESAIDELAHDMGMDPIALRLLNQPERHPTSGRPFSQHGLRQAFEDGADRFSWGRRVAEPGTLSDGEWRIGIGCAAGSFPYARMPGANIRITLRADGSAVLACSAQDMGMGTSTVQGQHAADRLGLPMEKISFEYGDSAFPASPMAGGSSQTVSIAAAIAAGAEKLAGELVRLAGNDSPLAGLRVGDVRFEDEGLVAVEDPKRWESFVSILTRAGREEFAITAAASAPLEMLKYAMHSSCAVFCELRVSSVTGEVRIDRILGSYDCGTILNPKTATSQFRGGIIMGIGAALTEETDFDERSGRIMNATLADYHVPAHLDVPQIDVIWTGIPDPRAPLGARGIGEIGITGVAAAIANAIFNATGKRVRDLPITLDKLL